MTERTREELNRIVQDAVHKYADIIPAPYDKGDAYAISGNALYNITETIADECLGEKKSDGLPMGWRRLPIVKLKGKLWYRDDRLRQYRTVAKPHEHIEFMEFSELGDSGPHDPRAGGITS